MKLKKWDTVHIRWQDIVGEGPNWAEDKDDLKPARCSTLGFILYNNKKSITVCGSRADDHVSDRTVIPKGCIVRIIKLQPVDET